MNRHEKTPKWAVFLAVGAVFAITVSTIFRLLTPSAPPIPQTGLITNNFNNTTSSFTNIAFTGTVPPLPETLPIITFEADSNTSETVKNLLIEEYALASSSDSNTVFLGVDYYLSTTNPQQWSFGLQTLVVPEGFIDNAAALDVATIFVQKHFGQNWQPALASVEYYNTDGADYHESPPETANVITIPFTQNIGDFPTYYTNQRNLPILVNITSENTVQRLSFSPTLFTLSSSGPELKTTSLEDAITNINQNQAAIISSTQERFGPLDMATIIGGTLTSVSVEYRTDEELRLAYPFYHLKGVLSNQQGTALNAEVITPAVATTTR